MKSVVLAFCIFQLTVLPAKYHIKKIWLFSRTAYAGNVPKRPDGKLANGYTRKLLCFLEITKNETTPDWQTAWFEGGKYHVTISPVNQDSLTVGIDKKNRNKIVIKSGDDTKLVELVLTLQERGDSMKAECFSLEGTFNKKHARLKWDDPIVELDTPLMP
jgi:hypothetical protein